MSRRKPDPPPVQDLYLESIARYAACIQEQPAVRTPLEYAKLWQGLYHKAVMANDPLRMKEAAMGYATVVWVLSGCTFFGCSESIKGTGGHACMEHCRATPGEVPEWGQKGEFLVTVADTMRVLVHYRPETTLDSRGHWEGWGFSARFDYNAVDFEAPFVSNTGYRFDSPRKDPEGLDVAEYARYAIIEHLFEKGKRKPLVYIDVDAYCRKQPRPAWVKGGYPGPSHLLRRATGQQLDLFGEAM